MNREKMITKIQDKLNFVYMAKNRDTVDKIISEVFDDVEKLRLPITLAEFLGWEEDKVYIFDNYKYKISNGSVLYFSEFSLKWEMYISKNIIDLRKAILEVQE